VSTLAGRLEDEPLPSVLQELFKSKATGTLKLEARVGKHEIFVREGFPVSVTLPGSAELLGKVLVEMGILGEESHKRSLAQPPPQGMKYGEWLVEQQLVSAEHMKLALKAQVRRKLHRLFFLNEGQFAFQAGEHKQGVEKQESLKVHPARAIYQGVRSAWNADRLKGALFLLDGQAMKCVLDENALTRYGLGQEDGKVAELLRGGWWTLAELQSASGLPLQPLHALLYALYVTEALELKDAKDAPPRTKTKSEPKLANPPPVNLLQPTAPMAAVRAESSGARKLPSTAFPPMMTPPPLTDPDSLRKQIIEKAKVVELQDLFAVLELTQMATRDQVKQAYFDAAKRYHPDRLTSLGLEAVRPEVEKIFRRVGEAYGTLYDDARREEYKKTLGKGRKEDPEAHQKAMKMLEAEMAFKRGETFLRKADWSNAIRELEQAVTLNPEEGEHLAHLAWARVNAGQMTFAEAKPRFTEAAKLSPKCGKAFYFLGLAYKEENDTDRALAAFRKGVELDTRLIEAEREIRLMQMRKDKSKGGLLDRFRKK
jgi:tetratricopeptide (TPR) repeat protein